MILRNVKIGGDHHATNVFVEGALISGIYKNNDEGISSTNELLINFDGASAFPGFINSHDHLEFNLFLQYGNQVYDNYLDWGKDIRKKYKEQIDQVLNVPLPLRMQWGLYKNLLCGVTTVVHHGEKKTVGDSLIHVFEDYHFLHSVALERNWKFKLNKPSSKEPFVIHVGEGTDPYSKNEIDKLTRWNFFKKEIIAVHGVSMDEQQAKSFKALVWCPASNLFFLNKTARVDVLKDIIPVIFGTDSTLSAEWNLWQHLRLAKKNSSVSDAELCNMLTSAPAKIWGLNNLGAIKENNVADIVMVKQNGDFSGLNPENILMVLSKGEIKLFDEKIAGQFTFDIKDYSKVLINGSVKFVYGNLTGLIAEIKKYFPGAGFPVQVV